MATMTGNVDALTDDMLDTMNVTREFLSNRNIEKERMEATAPKVGNAAPDFVAERLSADGKRTGTPMKLSDLFDKPVGLLLGSYTCPIFRYQLARYEEIHQFLKDRINFLCVYILEAHPEDGWRVPHNWNKGICIPTPKGLEQRADVAGLCVSGEGFTIPMVLDTMENDLLKLYAGSPERLYAIGSDGIIAHKSSVGPFDDEDVEAWGNVLQSLAGG